VIVVAHRQLKVTTQLDPTELARLIDEPETRATVQMRTDEILRLLEASGEIPVAVAPPPTVVPVRRGWLAAACVLVTIGSIFAIVANWS
jgi:hypothetical protein